VDVLTVESVKMATEFEAGDFRMPVLLDIEASDSEDEIVAIGAGQFRRKSPGTGREWMNDENGASGDERRSTNGATVNGAKRRRG
jgi:COMPASS component SWD1